MLANAALRATAYGFCHYPPYTQMLLLSSSVSGQVRLLSSPSFSAVDASRAWLGQHSSFRLRVSASNSASSGVRSPKRPALPEDSFCNTLKKLLSPGKTG